MNDQHHQRVEMKICNNSSRLLIKFKNNNKVKSKFNDLKTYG